MNEKKMTPEELARQKRAEKQLEHIDEVREKAIVPIGFSARPLKKGDQATSFEELAQEFPAEFVQTFVHKGKTHRWHCVRKSHFEIFPDADDDEDDVTMRALYSDAVTLIAAVVVDPPEAKDPEQLKRLPTTLVTRISRGIQDEIMPRYSEEPNEVEEEPEDTDE